MKREPPREISCDACGHAKHPRAKKCNAPGCACECLLMHGGSKRKRARAAADAAALAALARADPQDRVVTLAEVEARSKTRAHSGSPRSASEAATLNGTNEVCTVCLDEYEEGDEIRELECEHAFHKTCIDEWLTTKRACCPCCKHSLVPAPAPSGDARDAPGTPPRRRRRGRRGRGRGAGTERAAARAQEAAAKAGSSWGMTDADDEINERQRAIEELDWRSHDGKLSDKQEKQKQNIRRKEEKIANMRTEVERIRAKESQQDGGRFYPAFCPPEPSPVKKSGRQTYKAVIFPSRSSPIPRGCLC